MTRCVQPVNCVAMMESAKVSVRSASSSPTDLSVCNSKRKSSNHNNNNNNNNSKRFRLSEATESAAAAAAVAAAEAEEASRAVKGSAPSSSSAAVSPIDNQSHSKLLGMPDQNTASMLAAMAFVTRARSGFMIGDILNPSRWDPSQHPGHPLLGPYHQGAHPAAAAALMAATAASVHPQHGQHGLNLHHHHHLLQHPSMMEAIHHHHHHHRDTSKSEEESEVDVESNASYNSQTSREWFII